MVSDLVENLTRDVMLELAGKTHFERGEGYHRGGHVYDLVEHGGVIVRWSRLLLRLIRRGSNLS
jgi:hypothetical protein